MPSQVLLLHGDIKTGSFSLRRVFWFVWFLTTCLCCCSVVAMETRQYVAGDKITMRLMRREKGALVALPSSQWVKVEEPVRFGGKSVPVLWTRSFFTFKFI